MEGTGWRTVSQSLMSGWLPGCLDRTPPVSSPVWLPPRLVPSAGAGVGRIDGEIVVWIGKVRSMVRSLITLVALVAGLGLMASNVRASDSLHPRVKMVTTLGEFVIELDGKFPGFVFPVHLVEVEESRELPFALVSEIDDICRVRIDGSYVTQLALASVVELAAGGTSSGNRRWISPWSSS